MIGQWHILSIICQKQPIKGEIFTKTFENYLCRNVHVICNHFGARGGTSPPWECNHCHQVSLDPHPTLTWLHNMYPLFRGSEMSRIQAESPLCYWNALAQLISLYKRHTLDTRKDNFAPVCRYYIRSPVSPVLTATYTTTATPLQSYYTALPL